MVKASAKHESGDGFTAYLGHIVNPVSATGYEDITDGALIVGAAGRIACVGKWQEIRDSRKDISNVVDFKNRLILPGLVDLHIHLPQVTQIGRSGDTLLGWLEKYIFPAESEFSDHLHARKIADWFFDELSRNGTTLACVFTTIHDKATDEAFQAAARKGSRVVMGKVMMDRNSPPSLTENVKDSITQSKALIERWHGYDEGRLLYALTPRFAITSSDELLLKTGELLSAHEGVYLHTHLSESQEEVTTVGELFPGARSYFDVYASCGLAGQRSIFAHAIHLDDGDIKDISRSGCALAYCPSSNFFLKSGVFPFSKIKKAGIRFGLGSDVAAGPSMCLFGVMKDANFIQPSIWIPPAELLYHATLGGAAALSLDQSVGSLTPGKEADFIVVDPTNRSAVPDDMLDHPTDEILSVLVFLGDDRMIDATYVRGRNLYHNKTKDTAGQSRQIHTQMTKGLTR